MLAVVVDHVDGALSIKTLEECDKTLEESGMMRVIYEG